MKKHVRERFIRLNSDPGVIIFWIFYILLVLALVGVNSGNDEGNDPDYYPDCVPGPYGPDCD